MLESREGLASAEKTFELTPLHCTSQSNPALVLKDLGQLEEARSAAKRGSIDRRRRRRTPMVQQYPLQGGSSAFGADGREYGNYQEAGFWPI